MPEPFEAIEVAVVLISNGAGQYLAVYNAGWGAFSLPMTKRRSLPGPNPNDPPVPEAIERTAVRAAAEVLGRPLPPGGQPTRLADEIPPWNQSDRNGKWKRYTYVVFALQTPTAMAEGVWLTPAEFADHEPVSPTARTILERVG